MSLEDERRLYEHYSMDFGDFDYDRDYTGQDSEGQAPVGRDTSGRTTDGWPLVPRDGGQTPQLVRRGP